MRILRLVGLIFFAISLCLSACGEIDTPVGPIPDEVKSEISINPNIITNGLSFTCEAGEKSVSFITNEDWTLNIVSTPSDETWCTASATSGAKGDATLKFSVTENTSYDDRSVSVTIKSGTVSKTFAVIQTCANALLLTTNKYDVGQEGGFIEIEVKANIEYKMEISEKAKGWIIESSSRGLTPHKHFLEIGANGENKKREGEIYFKNSKRIEIVTIYQSCGDGDGITENPNVGA